MEFDRESVATSVWLLVTYEKYLWCSGQDSNLRTPTGKVKLGDYLVFNFVGLDLCKYLGVVANMRLSVLNVSLNIFKLFSQFWQESLHEF